ncbi:MAG: type II toxin-antitoxin system VapC family toxin [Thiobacillaceae bacterium]|nr:type II toxin-antitoxin system VapC family toxin [Thiobacillaceae bacterium]MCX7672178.1 type II toxin-antitoxin system VapC family toxin [Thiobacillaceae bacterium]MDW8324053.1 type II toxin-antitoxin system VapC family toxin [Burkholderiales bacterium]
MAPLLLDTHVALWWFTAHPRLTPQMQDTIARSPCHLSAASIWEVAIKHRLGKLTVAPHTLIELAQAANMHCLSVTAEHCAATAELPLLHGDPFDRLLIAQARIERLRLLTCDAALSGYGGDIQVV